MTHGDLARLSATALAVVVGLVSLRMAAKGLFAREWLRFHEEAAGVEWRSLAPGLRPLLLFMVRMVGLAFLVVFLLLALVPAYLWFHPDRLVGSAILGIGTVFCAGLGLLNRRLHLETGAGTPWKQSFAAAGLLAAATALWGLAG